MAIETPDCGTTRQAEAVLDGDNSVLDLRVV